MSAQLERSDNLTVQVAIDGHQRPVTVWRQATVMALIQAALWVRGTANEGYMLPPDNCQLRDRDGRLLDSSARLGDWICGLAPLLLENKPPVGGA